MQSCQLTEKYTLYLFLIDWTRRYVSLPNNPHGLINCCSKWQCAYIHVLNQDIPARRSFTCWDADILRDATYEVILNVLAQTVRLKRTPTYECHLRAKTNELLPYLVGHNLASHAQCGHSSSAADLCYTQFLWIHLALHCSWQSGSCVALHTTFWQTACITGLSWQTGARWGSYSPLKEERTGGVHAAEWKCSASRPVARCPLHSPSPPH